MEEDISEKLKLGCAILLNDMRRLGRFLAFVLVSIPTFTPMLQVEMGGLPHTLRKQNLWWHRRDEQGDA